jgi:hypothetical protein
MAVWVGMLICRSKVDVRGLRAELCATLERRKDFVSDLVPKYEICVRDNKNARMTMRDVVAMRAAV